MPSEPTVSAPIIRDLGRMAYESAFSLQKRLQQEVIESRLSAGGDGHTYLLLVEHDPPVITVPTRRDGRKHLIATDRQLVQAGVEVSETNRGGDITCHGPGQLVAYPILDLNALGLRLHEYMRFLEQVAIDTLAAFGVAGYREPGATGVWVGEDPAQRSKICAMGVRVSRWVSMHGLALNVTTDLAHFDLIVPCGLAGRSVTSLERELGEACPSMAEVKEALVERLRSAVAAAARAAGTPTSTLPRQREEADS